MSREVPADGYSRRRPPVRVVVRCPSCGADSHLDAILVSVVVNLLLDEAAAHVQCQLCGLQLEQRIDNQAAAVMLDGGATLKAGSRR